MAPRRLPARRDRRILPRFEILESRLAPAGPGTWSVFQPNGDASPRWGASLVAIGPDPTFHLGKLLIFGGTDGTTTFNDLTSILPQAVLATPLSPPSSPPARHDHAAVSFHDQLVVFGGQDAGNNVLADVWVYDPAGNTWQTQTTTGPNLWPGAFGASATVVGQRILVFGGTTANGQLAAATPYAFDPATGSWTALAADPLGPDASPLTAEFQGKLYVFSSTSRTIECLDPVQNSWSTVAVAGATPPPRAHAAGAGFRNLFWLTAGAGSANDTWQFNFTTNSWQGPKASYPVIGGSGQGNPPIERMSATVFESSGAGIPLFTVFGGRIDAPNQAPAATNAFDRYQPPVGILADSNLHFPITRLVTAEPGGKVSFTVQGFGTLPLSLTNPAEGAITPAQLVFANNGGKAQTVTITANPDPAAAGADGDVVYQVELGPIRAPDPDYNGYFTFLLVVARDLPALTVNQPGSYTLADHLNNDLKLSSGQLPPGMQFDASTSTVRGTPTRLGDYPLSFTNAFAPGAESWSFTLHVDQPVALLEQPQDQAVVAGTTVTFKARATGSPLSEQWQVSIDGGTTFTNIEGAAAPTLMVPATVARNGEVFRAVFTDPLGNVKTRAATLTVTAPPVLAVQPANQAVVLGSSATFTATASGNPPPTVQWQAKAAGATQFSDLPGQTATTLTIASVAQADNGNQYRAVFTNALGSATSHVATLTLGTLPAIASPPADQSARAGQPVTFKATATGTPAPQVQWYVSSDGATFQPLPGATATSLHFTAQPGDDGNRYLARFTNAVGTQPTSSVALTVTFAPQITTQPAGQTVAVGGTATFTAAASGDPPLTGVQWQKKPRGGAAFTDLPGATDATLTLPSLTAADNGSQYRAVFTNALGHADTRAAPLIVTAAPLVTLPPTNQTAANGGTATFSAAAVGNPAPTVQWQKKAAGAATFSDLPGQTAATLNLSGVGLADSGTQYRAVFTSALGTVTTRPATLAVELPPAITLQPLDAAVAVGHVATFTAAASGTTPTVQWQVSTAGQPFVALPGATNARLTVTAPVAARYRAVFTNAVGEATSDDVALVVY